MSMAKMGRPPLPKEDVKSEIIFFRATQEEKSKLESEARKKKLKLSYFVRSFLFPQ